MFYHFMKKLFHGVVAVEVDGISRLATSCSSGKCSTVSVANRTSALKFFPFTYDLYFLLVIKVFLDSTSLALVVNKFFLGMFDYPLTIFNVICIVVRIEDIIQFCRNYFLQLL